MEEARQYTALKAPVYVRVTDALLALLAQYRISTASAGGRWRVGAILQVHPKAKIEKYCLLGNGHVIPATLMAFSYSQAECDVGMHIGRYTSIAQGATAMGPPHPTTWVSSSPFCYFSQPRRPFAEYFADKGMDEPELLEFDHGKRGVGIGHDVWIGMDAMIKREVKIGHGAVIAARSVVTKDVPSYAVVAGVPARVIRYRLPDTLIERFLKLAWWRFAPDQLRPLNLQEPEHFADQLEEQIAQGLQPAQFDMLTASQIVAAGELVG